MEDAWKKREMYLIREWWVFSGGEVAEGYLSVISENREQLVEMLLTTFWHEMMGQCAVYST